MVGLANRSTLIHTLSGEPRPKTHQDFGLLDPPTLLFLVGLAALDPSEPHYKNSSEKWCGADLVTTLRVVTH
jgi:hypothetical protein